MPRHFLLLLLLVPGPITGQRVVVNRRARQRQPIQTEAQNTEDSSYDFSSSQESGQVLARGSAPSSPSYSSYSDYTPRTRVRAGYNSDTARTRTQDDDYYPDTVNVIVTDEESADAAVSVGGGDDGDENDGGGGGGGDYSGRVAVRRVGRGEGSDEAASITGDRRTSLPVVRRERLRIRPEASPTSPVADTASSGSSSSPPRPRVRSRVTSRTRDSYRGRPEVTNEVETATTTDIHLKQRTRGRSRFRSRGSSSSSSSSGSGSNSALDSQRTNYNSYSSYTPELVERRVNPGYSERSSRDRGSGLRATGRSLDSRRLDLATTNSLESSAGDRITGGSHNQVTKVKFPRKNLFPKLPGYNPAASLETPKDASSDLSFSSTGRSSNRIRSDIKPTKTRPEPREVEIQSAKIIDDYENAEIQSSKEEYEDAITVTHQVNTQTMFTVLDGGTIKTLFVDTQTPSYEVIPVSELKSTYIEESPVIFAHKYTNNAFGVQETLFDAIHPTRTTVTLTSSVWRAGNRDTEYQTVQSTIYNVQTSTLRNTEEATLNPDIGQLGSIIQSVILGLLGGNILGGIGGNPPIPGLGIGNPGPQLQTHTRTIVTTTTSLSTLVLPVDFRGSEILKTIVETKTKVSTVTDVSVETVYNQPGAVASSQPFLPLAPTLHRATRVVADSVPTFPLLPGSPAILPTPPVLSSFITHTSTTVTTLSTHITSDIVITLGGREINTQYIEPVSKAVTLTSYTTQTVTVPQPTQPSLERLALLRAILNLNG